MRQLCHDTSAAGASVRSVVFILSDEIFLLCPPLLSQYEAGAGPCTPAPCHSGAGGVSPYLVIKHLNNDFYCLFLNVYCKLSVCLFV